MPVTLPETIVRRRCAALIPYARNARTHSDQQVAQIAASILEFGFTNPVLIDEEDGIIAGHGRVRAAPLCSPTTSWRSTPAGISRCSRSKLASWAKRGLTSASPALTSSNSASYSPRGPKVGPIPTMRQRGFGIVDLQRFAPGGLVDAPGGDLLDEELGESPHQRVGAVR